MTGSAAVSADLLRQHLDGRFASSRERARELAKDPRMAVTFGQDSSSQRAQTLDRLHTLVEMGLTQGGFPSRYGGGDDIGGWITGFEMLALGDLSLLVKVGVQFGLFGGAVLHLGTEAHHSAYLDDLMNGRLLGCFAMTETGHGSDVAAVRTTATFDPEAEEFVVHTPYEAARKDYIGNAARDGRMAVVFAQLVTGGEIQGVHAFLVPIRDAAGQPAPGVRIEDCGHKAGLNGVDNGRLWFDSVRIPRGNCSTVTPTSLRTAPTPRRSRTRHVASSRCSARWSRAGSASAGRPAARPRSPWRSRSGTARSGASSAPPAARRS